MAVFAVFWMGAGGIHARQLLAMLCYASMLLLCSWQNFANAPHPTPPSTPPHPGTGPLVFAFLFSAFTQTGSPLPYFPGEP